MDELRPLPVSKPMRVRLEVVRTMAACISASGTMLVLLRVFGVI